MKANRRKKSKQPDGVGSAQAGLLGRKVAFVELKSL
jgi:hypothetical protein